MTKDVQVDDLLIVGERPTDVTALSLFTPGALFGFLCSVIHSLPVLSAYGVSVCSVFRG